MRSASTPHDHASPSTSRRRSGHEGRFDFAGPPSAACAVYRRPLVRHGTPNVSLFCFGWLGLAPSPIVFRSAFRPGLPETRFPKPRWSQPSRMPGGRQAVFRHPPASSRKWRFAKGNAFGPRSHGHATPAKERHTVAPRQPSAGAPLLWRCRYGIAARRWLIRSLGDPRWLSPLAFAVALVYPNRRGAWLTVRRSGSR